MTPETEKTSDRGGILAPPLESRIIVKMSQGRGNYLIDVGSFFTDFSFFILLPQHVSIQKTRAGRFPDWLEGM